MKQKEILDVFCDDCKWRRPDWNCQSEIIPLPCVHKHICISNAKKAEILIEESKA